MHLVAVRPGVVPLYHIPYLLSYLPRRQSQRTLPKQHNNFLFLLFCAFVSAHAHAKILLVSLHTHMYAGPSGSSRRGPAATSAGEAPRRQRPSPPPPPLPPRTICFTASITAPTNFAAPGCRRRRPFASPAAAGAYPPRWRPTRHTNSRQHPREHPIDGGDTRKSLNGVSQVSMKGGERKRGRSSHDQGQGWCRMSRLARYFLSRRRPGARGVSPAEGRFRTHHRRPRRRRCRLDGEKRPKRAERRVPSNIGWVSVAAS